MSTYFGPTSEGLEVGFQLHGKEKVKSLIDYFCQLSPLSGRHCLDELMSTANLYAIRLFNASSEFMMKENLKTFSDSTPMFLRLLNRKLLFSSTFELLFFHTNAPLILQL